MLAARLNRSLLWMCSDVQPINFVQTNSKSCSFDVSLRLNNGRSSRSSLVLKIERVVFRRALSSVFISTDITTIGGRHCHSSKVAAAKFRHCSKLHPCSFNYRFAAATEVYFTATAFAATKAWDSFATTKIDTAIIEHSGGYCCGCQSGKTVLQRQN